MSQDKIQETDRLQLELHKSSLNNANQGVQLAQANFKLAQQNYQMFLIELARKYGLNDNDSIKPDGSIVRVPMIPVLNDIAEAVAVHDKP